VSSGNLDSPARPPPFARNPFPFGRFVVFRLGVRTVSVKTLERVCRKSPTQVEFEKFCPPGATRTTRTRRCCASIARRWARTSGLPASDFSATPFKAKISNAEQLRVHTMLVTRLRCATERQRRRSRHGSRRGERASPPRQPARREGEGGSRGGHSGEHQRTAGVSHSRMAVSNPSSQLQP
jgi:hypothetical protein